MTTDCLKCGAPKEPARPNSKYCRICDKQQRTKRQNELLATHVLQMLSSGFTYKDACAKYHLPMNTLHSIMKRYKLRHGFKTTYQMLAAYVVIQTQDRILRTGLGQK